MYLVRHGLYSDLAALSIFQILCSIGQFLITIALPYYLYATLGYSLWQVCLFFAWWCGAFVLALPFVGSVINSSGIRHAIAMRSWVQAIFWLVFPLALQPNFWLTMAFVTPLFLIRALGMTTSLVAYDTFLAQHTKAANRGQTIAFMHILIVLASAIAPLIGGIITYVYGLKMLGIVATGIFILSGVVLVRTPDATLHVPYTMANWPKLICKAPRALIWSQFGYAIPAALLWIIWPIFLSFVADDIIKVSGILALSALLSGLSSLHTGRIIDHVTKPMSLHKKAIIGTVINVIRSLWYDPVGLIILDVCYRANRESVLVQHDRDLYNWLQEKDSLARSTIRWFFLEVAYTACLLVLALIFYVLQVVDVRLVFIPVFLLGTLCSLWISRISELQD